MNRLALGVLIGFAFTTTGGVASAQGVPPYIPPVPVGAPPIGGAPMGTPPDRQNLPEVLTAPPKATDPAAQSSTVARFRAAYVARKSPRIAVFWNRVLSADVESQKYKVDTEVRTSAVAGQVTTNRSAGASTSYQPYGYGSLAQTQAGSQSTTSFGAVGGSTRERIQTEGQVGSGGRAPVMAEKDMWRFEKGFEDPLLRAGAKLVDRSAMIRIAGDKNTKTTDVQRIEMSALRGHADIFIEVLMTYDSGSPSGYLFRATAKDVNTGEVIADAMSDGATPGSGLTEYVATNRGFEARPSRAAGNANGAEIALAMMTQLAQSWGH